MKGLISGRVKDERVTECRRRRTKGNTMSCILISPSLGNVTYSSQPKIYPVLSKLFPVIVKIHTLPFQSHFRTYSRHTNGENAVIYVATNS